VIQCHPELVTLFQCLEGIEEVVARGTELPGFDLHCPLLSLPLVMGTRLETIPSTTPYLRADAELSSRWRERLPNDGLKVGLVWSGLPTHPRDRIRSIPLSKLSALAPIPKVNFISLNKNRIAQEKREFELLDWTDELHDFAETAALIENLDLVISIDTAVAHLAGAMGKPVWVLLPLVPDWRWMLDRDDSPWYPSVKLFRQASAGDWDGPVERIAQELTTWISRRQP
jgi:hypothetical protein